MAVLARHQPKAGRAQLGMHWLYKAASLSYMQQSTCGRLSAICEVQHKVLWLVLVRLCTSEGGFCFWGTFLIVENLPG